MRWGVNSNRKGRTIRLNGVPQRTPQEGETPQEASRAATGTGNYPCGETRLRRRRFQALRNVWY